MASNLEQFYRKSFNKQTTKLISIIKNSFKNHDDYLSLLTYLKRYFEFACSLLNINHRIPCLHFTSVNNYKIVSHLKIDSLELEQNKLISYIDELINEEIFTESQPGYSDEAFLLNDILRILKTYEVKGKVEIYLFTYNCSLSLTKMAKFINSNMILFGNVKFEKKIKVINCFDKISKLYENDISDIIDSNDMSFMIDIVNLRLDFVFINEMMKSWLIDSSKDSEHLNLVLNKNYEIKCDIYERLLSPYDSFRPEYFLKLKKSQVLACTDYDSELISPIFKLNAVRFIKYENVCESLLYGDPIILKPTSNCKLKLNEIESNANIFAIFSMHLEKNGLGLLCKLDLSTDLRVENSDKPKKSTFYLILPRKSDNNFSLNLMMKSIITRSILLNDDILDYQYEDEYLITNVNKNKQQINDFYEHVVKKLKVVNNYNPLAETDDL